MSAFSHAGHTRKQAVPRTKRERPAARDTPGEDQTLFHGEVRRERNIPFSRGRTTEQQAFSVNVYTTEDPASIYTRGPGGVGERARPRWTPDNRIVILHGLRSDPKIKEYNRVSVDMEPDTSWTIEAVDSEMSGKEEDRTPGARSAVIDESDREEILYPRNLGATPLKPQSDFLITSSHDTPKRPLMPEIQHSTPSSSAFSQQTRSARNHPYGDFELAQSGSRSSMQRVGLTPSTTDNAKDDKASARKHGHYNGNTPSPLDGKENERRRQGASSTTNALKSRLFPGNIPERHAMRTSTSSSSSNVGDGYHARRVHTPDLSYLPVSPSPSPAIKQHPPLTPNTPTAQLPSSPQPPHNPHKANSPPNAPHVPLRGGGAQEGWSSLDDVATAEALRKLDRRVGQRARARVHSFGRPPTAPNSPAGRTSPGREGVDTSDSGKSKRGGGGGGGVKVSPFFLLRPLRKSSAPKDPQLSIPSPSLGSILSTDSSAHAPTQVGNPTKTLDRAAHSSHAGTAAPATSPSANLPHPTARGSASSVHRNRPKRVSPSSIPVFRRSSSQSAQSPLASASDALSSASQNTLSTNELRSPAGIASSPPAKPAFPSKIVRKARHQRSSSAPFPVPHPNGNTNASRPPSSSPHAPLSSSSTHTSPHAVPRRYARRAYVVYAPLGMAYPAELAAYPLEEVGYRNEKGVFVGYAERPELSASLPCKGRAPKRPYEIRGLCGRWLERVVGPALVLHRPIPRGLTPPKHTAKRTPNKKSPPTTAAKQELPKSDAAEALASKAAPPRPDPWDLDTILAAHRARRPRSPTSSSSSYGSAHSTRSRASSFSGSAGGHIPGTSRDVMAFPFGYPTSN
ncbi:hypothetical protein BJ912DRAFT_1140121 [Pholiota molesta]|nr:hypothetical protein BJ912DRAFT_1140121 [Pholiota molesta]